MLLRSSYFMFRRMLRGYLGLVILLVLPIILISVLGLVIPGAWDDEMNLPVISVVAVINILAFQLFGGNYTLEFLRDDFFSPRKWKLFSVPQPPYRHTGAIVVTSALFSALQGMVLVLFTQVVYGVNWGSLGWIAAALLLFSSFNQLVYMTIALLVPSAKFGERVSEVYGLGSIALAGVWFPMPDMALFRFVTTYGNPLSLGRNLFLHIMTGLYPEQAVYSTLLLLAMMLGLGAIAVTVGRRKLA